MKYLVILTCGAVLVMQCTGLWYTMRVQTAVDGTNQRFSTFLTTIQTHTNTARENRLYTEYNLGRIMDRMDDRVVEFMTVGSPGQKEREIELIQMEKIAGAYYQRKGKK